MSLRLALVAVLIAGLLTGCDTPKGVTFEAYDLCGLRGLSSSTIRARIAGVGGTVERQYESMAYPAAFLQVALDSSQTMSGEEIPHGSTVLLQPLWMNGDISSGQDGYLFVKRHFSDLVVVGQGWFWLEGTTVRNNALYSEGIEESAFLTALHSHPCSAP